MKPNMTQMILTVIAVLFSMALALTVALICLSYSDLKAEPTDATVPDGGSDATLRLPPATTPDTSTPPKEEPPPEEMGNGLSFTSNGDGTCTLSGIGKCDDACIVIPETSPAGDLVTAIAPRALYGCTFVTAIQIPATVTRIGALAFAACPSLVYLSVDSDNEEYCDIDGILYTSDGRALLAYPAMRAGNSITISSVTLEIQEMAFYNCAHLTHVYYSGSAEQWEQIRIEPKNYSLTAASKTFYGGK